MRIYTLAEKREQAEKIAAGLGLSPSTNCYRGRFAGHDVTVGWASGHLFSHAEPDKVKPDIDWRSPSSLLPMPTNPPLVLKDKRAKDRYSAIKSQLEGQDAVWLATDPDREGEAIGWNILQVAAYKGPVYRMWLTESLEPPDIQHAAKSLHKAEQHKCLWRAQEARSVSDWFYQFATRAFTMLARRGKLGAALAGGSGKSSVASLGRVQTAALALVVERDRAIESFVPVTHYIPVAVFQGGGAEVRAIYQPKLEKGEEVPYFTDKSVVDRFLGQVRGVGKGDVVLAETKHQAQNPPLPYSMTQLQRAMSRKHGISPSKTLEIADSLRLRGFLTYPRTEHGELPASMYTAELVGTVLKTLSGVNAVARQAQQAFDLHFGAGAKAPTPACFTTKPMEHHGIVPTHKKAPLDEFTKQERAIYEACARQLVQAMFPAAKFEARTLLFQVAAEGLMDESSSLFKATSKRLIDKGWKAAFGGDDEEDSGSAGPGLPKLAKGAVAPVVGVDSQEKTTTPPKPFTLDALLAALLHAGRHTNDANARAMLNKVSGIGTPATRHTIIDTLRDREFIKEEKGQVVRSTERGRALYDAAPKSLSSVVTTAEWEMRLKRIEAMTDDAQARQERDAFIQAQAEFVTSLIKDAKAKLPDHEISAERISGAKKLAEIHGVEIPPEIEKSAEALNEFVAQLRARGMPPTPKMRDLADQIATRKGETLDPSVLSNFDACKRYLDNNTQRGGNGKKKGGGGKPSEKMVGAAEAIAKRKNVKLPRGYKTNFEVCKQFLDAHPRT